MQQLDLTPTQAREQLETARREAAEAAGLGEALREQVRDGEDVTAEQLAAQDQLTELAQLRITAAERKLKAALAADLDVRARAVAARIGAVVDDDSTGPILDAAQAVVEAVRGLLAATSERHDTIRQVAVEGVQMNEELGRSDNNPWPSRDGYGFMAQTTTELSVTVVGQGNARAIPAGRVLGVVLRETLDDSSTRSLVQEALGLSREGLQRHAEAIPGLAEVLAGRAPSDVAEG